ncbi:uncharacterized protein LOC122014318 isoform X1 [Zingiber officinale]|uniref:Uncharacterized protein n=1 Tax=Zingiber officinale TaxID=94328 RepID=A0A8J5F8T4_ZINOF|nr:uncharacterized protein LOC122014318 isoform X1 [Zingiber officinale]KAG6483776.1 hypothetical protein ZIOFF_060437 [Zingiber officinale]
MGVWGESSRWCLCSGWGRSERVKDSIFASKGLSLASISVDRGGNGCGGAGTGFLIHRHLLLTTHAHLPSAAVAEAAEIQLCHGCLAGCLVPQRFFITSSILDLTIVGLDILDDDSTSQVQKPNPLKTCCHPSLDLGNLVYLLGHTVKKELKIGEAKIVVATDNLIKLSLDGVPWYPGSAGFDVQGNLAFMICDPMKLATSPAGRSPTSSSTAMSSKKDTSTQFGIPISVICDWLYQHWEGSLDEVSKPKLSTIQLSSMGLKTWPVFQMSEEVNDDISSSPPVDRKSRHQFGPSCSSNSNAIFCPGKEPGVDLDCIRDQGIPTPEIFESPKLISGPIQKKEPAPLQLLDINFPLKVTKSILLPLPFEKLTDENTVKGPIDDLSPCNTSQANAKPEYKLPPVGTWQDHCSEVHSSSSPELLNEWDQCSSEKQTMYSAETMESRNIPSTKGTKLRQVGRSRSCVNYSRWSSMPLASKAALQKQQTLQPARKKHSQTSVPVQRNRDYYGPTVSSIKKQNNSGNQRKLHQTAGHMSQKWNF